LLPGYRWGVAALAWVAPIPFLLYARRVRSVKQALILLGVLLGTSAAQVAKIVTPPISYGMVPGFSIPITLSFAVVLALTEWLRRRVGETPGLFAFAALTASGDWLYSALTPIGAWGATGNSQVDSLVLLQFASLFGLPGIGFLMGLFQSSLSLLLGSPGPRIRWKPFALACVAVSLVLVYETIRLSGTQERTVSVAAVVTDLGLDGKGLPTREALAENTENLYRKTRAAASRGATLVSWNEVAAVVETGDEEAFLERGKIVARELDIDLVLAYGTLVSRSPLLFDNKYAFITREGTVAETYRKHHPFPGEPSMRGNDPLRAIDRPYGRVAGAICYDYDFPAIARGHAALGAELEAVALFDGVAADGSDPDPALPSANGKTSLHRGTAPHRMSSATEGFC
jgi:apolipoprotein N-acyltransferase